jgi:hypothetical protein
MFPRLFPWLFRLCESGSPAATLFRDFFNHIIFTGCVSMLLFLKKAS